MPPHPHTIVLSSGHILSSRNRKLEKLKIQRQQSKANRRENQPIQQKTIAQKIEVPEKYNNENLLQHIDESSLSSLSSDGEQGENQSFDSEVHDIYNVNTLQSIFRHGYSMVSIEDSILDVRKIKDSDLILDFKIPNRQLGNTRNLNSEDDYFKNISKMSSPYLKIASPDLKGEKRSSFMEYYNSLQKKDSSKLLSQYIKQKK